MPITPFGQASDPVDGGTTNGPTNTITPPASMVADDYVVVVCQAKNATRTLTVGTTGGQTWTSEMNRQDATSGMTSRVFRCRFNGAWDADPTFVADTGTAPQSAWMLVFRGVNTATALDVAEAGLFYLAPLDPFDVTVGAITTATDGAMAIFVWGSADDNDWALQTAGWSNPGAITQVKNLAGTDMSMSIGYKEIAAAGSTGSVTNRQTARGGDGGISHTLALKPAVSGQTFFQTLPIASAQALTLARRLDYFRTFTVSSTFTAAVNRLTDRFRTLPVVSVFENNVSRAAQFYRALSVTSPHDPALVHANVFTVALAATGAWVANLLTQFIEAPPVTFFYDDYWYNLRRGR